MIIDILVILHLSLVISFTLRILWRYDLTPTARLAWFIILLFFPYVSVVIYWMFGEVNLGASADEHRQDIIQQLHEKHPDALGDNTHLASHVKPCYHPAFAYAASINGFASTMGNTATLLANATDAKTRMIADFDTAREQIHVLYYIWLNDETGTAVAQALIRAAQRGVACRAMVDGLGSRKLVASELWQQMRAAGVELAVAMPLTHLIKTLLFSRIDLRNHRKITIIDGKITYCGSQNCADPEFRIKPKYAPWVDIMLRFEGNVVAQNQLLFASDWLVEKPDTPLEAFTTHITNIAESETGFVAQVFGDGPTERLAATPQLFATLLAQAQQRITISTPYFVPDYSVINAICAAAYRGIAVTMIFPKRNDSFIVAATSRSYYRQLLEAGVSIYEYKDGLLHAKTLTVDSSVSLIGSSNMDLRSFDLNYENNILINDKTTTQAIETRQQNYIEHADHVTLASVLGWSIPRRIWYNVVATIGPVL